MVCYRGLIMIVSMIGDATGITLDEKEGLRQALCCEDIKARIYAVKALEGPGDERSISLLVDALRDEQYDVRETAYRTLRKLGHRAMPGLVSALRDENFYVRMYATLAITDEIIGNPGRKYDEAIVDALTHALLDKSIYVRRSAYDALKVLEYNKILRSLISSLKDPDPAIRLEAVVALGKIGDKRAMKALIRALSEADAGIRRCVVSSLGRMKDKKATDALLDMLYDLDGGVRKEAVRALGAIQDERAVSGLLQAMKDLEPSVREEALYALRCYRSFKYVTPFVSALEDTAEVRNAAIRAMGKVRGCKSVDILISVLGDKDPEARELACTSLASLGNCAVKPLRSALNHDDGNVRGGAAHALELVSKARAQKRIDKARKPGSPELWVEIKSAVTICPKEKQSRLSSFDI
jgi:HEAT repeat protein